MIKKTIGGLEKIATSIKGESNGNCLELNFTLKPEIKGFLGLMNKPELIEITALGVQDDISLRGEIERKLREEVGYGLLDIQYNKESEKIFGTYQVINQLPPSTFIRSKSTYRKKSNSTDRPVFSTAGIDNK